MAQKTAYSYIRFSRAHQAAGNSLERQMANTRSYCAQNGLRLDESQKFHDLGVSAFTGKNRQSGYLGKFLELVRNRQIPEGSALVIESLDRLSRQRPLEVIGLLHQLLAANIEIHLTSANKVFRPTADATTETMDLIMAAAFALRSHDESAQKAERLQKAWLSIRKKAAEGRIIHTKPKQIPWWIEFDQKSNKLIAPANRAKTVRHIFQRTADGLSSVKIARELNSRNDLYNPYGAKKWISGRVRGLILSRGPEGYLEATPKTRKAGRAYEPIPGYYPPVIDNDLAEKARAAHRRNNRGPKDRGRRNIGIRPINIFKGLLYHKNYWCSFGTRQNGTIKNGKRGFHGYYICMPENEGKTLFSIAARQLEPFILSGLNELTVEDIKPKNPLDKQAKEIDNKLADSQARLENLLVVAETAKDINSLKIRINDLSEKIEILKTQRAELSTPTPDFKNFEFDIGKLTDNSHREYIRDELRRIIKKIEIGTKDEDFKNHTYPSQKALEKSFKTWVGDYKNDPVKPLPRFTELTAIITFHTGARRIIIRIPKDPDLPNLGTLFSLRLD